MPAEKQIGKLQEEIEATMSRLNFLKDEVAFSTINLQLYEVRTDVVVTKSEDSITDRFRDAFSVALNGSVEILIALTRVWPLLIITTVLVMYVRRKREGMSL